MRQNVFVLGASGNVGRALVGQIAQNDVPELGIHRNPTVIVGMADSEAIAMNEGGFSAEALKLFATTRQKVRDVAGKVETDKSNVWGTALEISKMLGYTRDLIFVDVTAARDAATDFHQNVIEDGGRIVTANKNPIALSDYQTYYKLTQDPTRYGYSATAMAGLGAVPWIREREAIQDHINTMTASLSGTLGYITDQLTQGKKLSEAIREARAKGYTEPDFRDDLNGIDVARKLIILAREAGHRVEMEDVEIEAFLPPEYFEIKDPEDCLRQIEERLDPLMQKRYDDALAAGLTFKYLADFGLSESGKPRLEIRLSRVRLSSPFGSLKGTANRIEAVTGIYSAERPFQLEGPGAGLDVTASVVRRDLLNMQPKISRLPHR